MKRFFVCPMLVALSGCLCGSDGTNASRFDEMGLLRSPEIRYELRVERNAALVTVNGENELVVCETFSEGCHLHDLPSPLPRLRHHEDTVDLGPYLVPGANTVEVSYLPDGEEESLSFTLVRIESETETVLARRELAPSADSHSSVSVETPTDCIPPPFPSLDWVVQFLDPFPEALRTWNDELYASMLIPPTSREQAKNRKAQLETLRSHPMAGEVLPASAIRQTHRSAPLSMSYSCETKRLSVYPSDGAYLVAIVDVVRDSGDAEARATNAAAVEFVNIDGSWYLARF